MLGAGVNVITKDDPNYWLLSFIILWFVWHIYDLKKESGYINKYFEGKINYLLGYTSKVDENISEKTIFDFYLAHQTNPDFFFEPKDNTAKIIWKYLSSANLLDSFKEIEITDEILEIANNKIKDIKIN